MSTQVIQGNALEVLQTLPEESVNCIVTSPPYWGLQRDAILIELNPTYADMARARVRNDAPLFAEVA